MSTVVVKAQRIARCRLCGWDMVVTVESVDECPSCHGRCPHCGLKPTREPADGLKAAIAEVQDLADNPSPPEVPEGWIAGYAAALHDVLGNLGALLEDAPAPEPEDRAS